MKYLVRLIILLIAIGSGELIAQTQLSHEKKVWESPDGKLYIQKSLPLYFWITDERTSQDTHRLISETAQKYTNPMYLELEGLNTIFSPSAVDTVTKLPVVPQRNVNFQIYADSKHPVSKLKNNGKPYKKDKILFFGKGLEISISAEDKVSGVAKIYYSIDGTAFEEYKKPLTFPVEKQYTLKYYSVDNVGNVEPVQEMIFTIDFSKPLTNLIIHGDQYNNIISSRSSIALQPEDAFAGISSTYYVIDNNPQRIYSIPISAINLTEGEHVLSYYSSDLVENQEDKQVYSFFVDKTPPIIIDEIMGDSYFANGKEYSSGRSKLKLSAIDNRAGVKAIYYSIENSEYQLYDKPFYLPSKKGNISIKFYAVDNVNNKTISGNGSESVKRFFNSYLDLAGPDLNYSFNGPVFNLYDTLYIGAKTEIVLKGTDSESGLNKIAYSIDKQDEQDYKTAINIITDGVHSVDFIGYDNVNNTNQKSFTVAVDATGPEIIHQFSLPPAKIISAKPVFPQHVILFLSAFDSKTGVEKITYSINGSVEKLYTGFIQKLTKGNYHLKITAYDFLKNQTVKEMSFIIE